MAITKQRTSYDVQYQNQKKKETNKQQTKWNEQQENKAHTTNDK